MLSDRQKDKLARLPKEDKIEYLKALMISTPDLLDWIAESHEAAAKRYEEVNARGGFPTKPSTIRSWRNLAAGIRALRMNSFRPSK
jgi:hypothetical protein